MSVSSSRTAALKAWILWILIAVVGLWLFAAYYPGFLHGDTQVRWVWATELAGGEEFLDESDYFHPFMTLVFLGILKSGLPVALVHGAQLVFFFVGFGLVAWRLVGGWGAVVVAVLLLLPPVWNFAVLQSSDTWVLIGCLWYLYGFTGRLYPCDGSAPFHRTRLAADLAAMVLGSVLVFCSRYNTTPLVLVFVVAPFLFRMPWRVALAVAVCGISGFGVSKAVLASVDLPEAYKVEMMMATDIVGIWKELRDQHPEARPSFWDAVPDEDALFEKHDPHNQRPLAWTESFFRAHSLGPVSEEIRADFRRYMREYPGPFWSLKLKTFQNPWGFVPPLGRWHYLPAPPSYMEFLKIEPLTHKPLVPGSYKLAITQLNGFYKAIGTEVMRPWLWWLLYLGLLCFRLLQRRVDAADALILFIAAGYFATFFVFSNGFLLRYFMPVFILLGIGSIRLALRPCRLDPAGPQA